MTRIVKERRWSPTGISRKCGTCQMCCVAVPIAEIDKKAGEACIHLCGAGCGIYDTRPDVCRGFACEWLWGMGGMEQRPDRMGALPTPALHGGQLALYLAPGVTPESLSKPAQKFIGLWHRKKRTAVLCIHGEGYNTTTAIFPDGEMVTKPTKWEGKLPKGQIPTEEEDDAKREAEDPTRIDRTLGEED